MACPHTLKVRLVLNAVSATWAILRRPILVAFYDTHGDMEDTFSTKTPGSPRGHTPFGHKVTNGVIGRCQTSCPDVSYDTWRHT